MTTTMTRRIVGVLAATLMIFITVGCLLHSARIETAFNVHAVPTTNVAIIAYSSNFPEETLLWGSTHAHQSSQDEVRMIAVGKDVPLFTPLPSDTTATPMRGWMYRFRTMVDGIRAELEQRNDKDFVVLIGDAYDTYLTESTMSNTLDLVLERFHAEFNASIVFSSQVYCCNPWNLHEIGRAGWDEYYDTVPGGPETIYKHLNAGMFVGYATAIVEMAHEMNIWEMSYKRPEEFDERIHAAAIANETIAMLDVTDIDDDEWQLSLWFIRDQAKWHPRAVLDVHQSLFTTTGTFRASHRDGGFLIFSPDDFYGVVGTLPAQWNTSDMMHSNSGMTPTHAMLDQVKQCPYTYNADTQTWTNTITKSQPLIFHFAGNDWLCACQILATEAYPDLTRKFANSCANDYPLWQGRVNEAVADISQVGHNPHQQIFLPGTAVDSDTSMATMNRQLSGYGVGSTAPTSAPVTASDSNCSISRFDLWNGQTDTVSLVNFTNRGAFCSSIFPVSLEAVDGNGCVRNVRFHLVGPDGYSFKNREFVPPYFLFGNSGSFINGRIMRPGNYTLQAVPNRGRGQPVTLQFYVDSC